MEKEFLEVIDKNLPNMVGSALKEKLKQADTDAESVRALRKQVEDYSKKDDIFRDLENKRVRLESAEKELKTKQDAFAIKEAVLNVKEEIWKERLADNRYLIDAVFANQRFKYSECGSVPLPVPGSSQYAGFVQPANLYNKSIDVR